MSTFPLAVASRLVPVQQQRERLRAQTLHKTVSPVNTDDTFKKCIEHGPYEWLNKCPAEFRFQDGLVGSILSAELTKTA
jgi:hypothetical protein